MIKLLLAVLIAFLYSLSYTVLGPMILSQEIRFDSARLLPFLGCFILFSVFNCFAFKIMPRLLEKREEKGHLFRYLEGMEDRKLFLIVWAFLFLAWVPAFLLFYPGILSYDMISQVGSAVKGIVNNHHPVLHTFLIRCFLKLGKDCFHEYESGLGLLTVLQMLLLSYALARLILLLKSKALPMWIVLLTTLGSAFWFMNACLSVTMIKDTLHAAFLVLFACHFIGICTEPLQYIQNKRNLILFPILVFFMCATRNNGIHIYLFCFLGLLVLRIRKIQIKKLKSYLGLLIVVVLPVLLFKLYSGPVFAAAGIAQGEVREALCIPIQQLQRVAVKRANELTKEQEEKIGYYIDSLEWMESADGRVYDPFFADPAKSCFYSGHYQDDPVAFWKFYLQTGEQFTKEYLVAFLSNTVGFWYPGAFTYSYVVYDNYDSEAFAVPLERKSIGDFQILQKIYKGLCGSDFWRVTPVFRLFFVPGFSAWLLICALAVAWRKGFFTKTLPIFLPLIAQFGIMLLSPMSSFRYSWPFYLMLPLALIGMKRDPEQDKMGRESAVESVEG